MMRLIIYCLIIICSVNILTAFAQTDGIFYTLWDAGKMPNSKGLNLPDEIRDERVYQVGKPGFYAYFPSKQENKKAAVVIFPGGGYERLAYQISGVQLAKWFNTMGIAAFVLNYRLPNSPDLVRREIAPLQDAERAMRIIRYRAAEWNIDPAKIGVMGTSAGGHLAAILGTVPEDEAKIGDALDQISFAPNFMILVSPVITMGEYAHATTKRNILGINPTNELIEKYSAEKHVSPATPPSYIALAADDKVVNPRNSLMFHQALLDQKIPTSLHIFPNGGHSIAVRNNPGSANEWTRLCELWLIETGIIAEIKK